MVILGFFFFTKRQRNVSWIFLFGCFPLNNDFHELWLCFFIVWKWFLLGQLAWGSVALINGLTVSLVSFDILGRGHFSHTYLSIDWIGHSTGLCRFLKRREDLRMYVVVVSSTGAVVSRIFKGRGATFRLVLVYFSHIRQV